MRTTVTYLWPDLNGDKLYQPGEVNLNVNGPDFVSQSGGSNTVPNPNEKEPKADEFFVSLERELMANFAVRVSGVYARTESYRVTNLLRPRSTYTIPVANSDPGPDGVVSTADDPGRTATYYEFPTSLAGRRFERFTLINDDRTTQRYKSFEVAAFKRLSNKWQIMASYSATKPDVPIMPGLTVDEFNSNVTSGPDNPNAEINTSNREWEWTGKLSGVYTLPFDIMLAAQYEHRGGYPWARQVLFRGGRTIPSITLNVEPVGSRRDPSTNQVDVRFEKSFKLTGSQRIAARMNIFNAFNANTVTNVVRLSGANFLLPRAIMDARIIEFGATYQF